MEDKQKIAIEDYQCSGCVSGSDIECFEKGDHLECGKHSSGTICSGIGHIFLGMPTGFDRSGPFKDMKIKIFDSFEKGWCYDKFNIPVWKYKNENNHILVRGILPRINQPFLHIFLEDCLNKIACLEITKEDIELMD